MLLFVSRTRAKLTFTFQIFLLLGSISFTNDKLEFEGRAGSFCNKSLEFSTDSTKYLPQLLTNKTFP